MSNSSESLLSHRASLHRHGAIAPLSAVCLALVMMVAAFAVDIGFIMVVKADLQRAADAAVQSAVLDYRNEGSLTSIFTSVRNSAKLGVESNPILRDSATLDLNLVNSEIGDILLGRIDFDSPRSEMTFDSPALYNAVKVRVRRTANNNGSVPLFFGRIFGLNELELEATATAALIKDVAGFKIPANGENIPILPITISTVHWDSLANSEAFDQWAFDAENQIVVVGADNIPEVVLFPNDTGSSGNLGTVNIGTSNNSTSFLGNQILNGVTQADLDFHGGRFEIEPDSSLILTGNPGLSGGIADDLAAITGEIRIIPIFSTLNGNGSGAEYSIERFEAVRVMAVHLRTGNKFLTVQPAKLSFGGLIQAPSSGTSNRIFSPPVIVQ